MISGPSHGGDRTPGSDDTRRTEVRPGHIPCTVCGQPIGRTDWDTALCWPDPDGVTAAAHGACYDTISQAFEDTGWVGL